MSTYELDFTYSECPINLNKESLFMKLYSTRLNTHCYLHQWCTQAKHCNLPHDLPSLSTGQTPPSNSPFLTILKLLFCIYCILILLRQKMAYLLIAAASVHEHKAQGDPKDRSHIIYIQLLRTVRL
jgi:hypothetical protein